METLELEINHQTLLPPVAPEPDDELALLHEIQRFHVSSFLGPVMLTGQAARDAQVYNMTAHVKQPRPVPAAALLRV